MAFLLSLALIISWHPHPLPSLSAPSPRGRRKIVWTLKLASKFLKSEAGGGTLRV
jgi:hypothetical protein